MSFLVIPKQFEKSWKIGLGTFKPDLNVGNSQSLFLGPKGGVTGSHMDIFDAKFQACLPSHS